MEGWRSGKKAIWWNWSDWTADMNGSNWRMPPQRPGHTQGCSTALPTPSRPGASALAGIGGWRAKQHRGSRTGRRGRCTGAKWAHHEASASRCFHQGFAGYRGTTSATMAAHSSRQRGGSASHPPRQASSRACSRQNQMKQRQKTACSGLDTPLPSRDSMYPPNTGPGLFCQQRLDMGY